MPISLGAVSDLLDPVFDEMSDDLVEPQRRARRCAGTETGPGRAPTGSPPTCARRGLRALAADAPLLLAIDDVQWLDPRRHACSRLPYVGSARSRSASSRP